MSLWLQRTPQFCLLKMTVCYPWGLSLIANSALPSQKPITSQEAPPRVRFKDLTFFLCHLCHLCHCSYKEFQEETHVMNPNMISDTGLMVFLVL